MKKQIELQQISLRYFKGIKDLTINFGGNANVFGENGTGKSTIEDAWNWLLFGKDAQGRKDFEIKTLDKYNHAIPKVDHEVEALIIVNNSPITLRRVFREKWQKPRGQAEQVFNGHETLFYWNDVPMQAKEYQAKIESILDENIFKIISNPLAFDGLKWQDRREVLIAMCGDVSDEELASENPDYKELAQILSSKTLEEYKRETSAKRKKLRDDLKMIPTRIDEAIKSKPEEFDFKALESEKTAKLKEIETVESQIQDKSKVLEAYYEKKNAHSRKFHEKKSELSDLKNSIERKLKKEDAVDDSKLTSLRSRLSFKNQDLSDSTSGITRLQAKQKAINSERETKRAQWHEINSKKLSLNDEEFKCPTCKRAFEAEDVEKKKADLQQNFRNSKMSQLEKIEKEGQQLKADFEKNEELLKESADFEEKLRKEISEIKLEIEAEQNRLDELSKSKESFNLEAELEKNEAYQKLQAELKEIEANAPVEETVDTEELKTKRQGLNAELEAIKSKLAHKTQIENVDKRVKELEDQEKNLSEQLLELEKKEFEAESFQKLKIETLERKINSHFKFVNFKLFAEQINGGIQEVCEALIDGVPFSNANTASRINAGLDIINSLCEYYKVNAPIFIDNRESVINLIETDSQIINLIVSKADKKLRVEAVEHEKSVA